MLLLPLVLVLALVNHEAFSHPGATSHRRPIDRSGYSNLIPPSSVNSNAYINLPSQLPTINNLGSSGYVNPLLQPPTANNNNGFINVPQDLPINQNSFVNIPQNPPVNQNSFINAQQNPPINQNGFVNVPSNLPTGQIGLVNAFAGPPINLNGLINLPQGLLSNPNGVINPPEDLPINQNGLVRLPQNLPVNQNTFVNIPPGSVANQNGFNNSTNFPVNQNGLVKIPQVSPNNQNAFINILRGSPGNQNSFNNPQGLPINQNGLINLSQGSLANQNSFANIPQSLPVNQNGLIKPLLQPQLNNNNNYPNSIPQGQSVSQNSFVDLSRNPAINNYYPVTVPPSRSLINSGLNVAFQWRYLDWVPPSVQLTRKNFTLGNSLSQDVDIDRKGRVFVTSPQWLEGVPITLSVIADAQGDGGPLLTPYPDWSWHKPDCDSLVSVYRIAIDECDRLWMVDTGSAQGQPICPSKIVVFDLKTDQLLLRYIIPEDQTVDRTASYVNPVVEVGDTCQDTHLYVADVLKHGLLVYNLRENRSWRVSNTRGNAFGHDPEATNLTIAGESFVLTDGTLGMSLSPKGLFDKRYLYFNSLASFYEKFVDTDTLKRSFAYEPIVYQSVYKRVSQAGAQATSRTGAIFFQLAEFTALACWNIERPFNPDNVVVLAQDAETLQYISGMKVIPNALGEEELWFNTNRLQKTINNSRRINEINYRFLRGKVDDLIRGTKCAPSGLKRSEPNFQGWITV